MSLNIKNPETYRLAKELAKQTGESVTLAVTIALKERLERGEKEKLRAKRHKVMLELTARTSEIMNDGRTTEDLFNELYDPETGLPA